LHVLGPGSTEHESLTVRTNLRNNLANLRLETHVQHTISFVHDKIGNTAQVGLAGFKHIDETTWSGDCDFHAALQVANLGAFWCAAVDGSITDSGIRAGGGVNSGGGTAAESAGTHPNLEHSAWIWTASSRVGAKIRTIGPSPGDNNGWLERKEEGLDNVLGAQIPALLTR
jgi:hypothetical protein